MRLRRAAALLAAVCLCPQWAWPCTVCFGPGNDKLAGGFFWGILLLLSLPAAMFILIGGKIYFSVRRKNAAMKVPASHVS